MRAKGNLLFIGSGSDVEEITPYEVAPDCFLGTTAPAACV